jgi:hypothetical protein
MERRDVTPLRVWPARFAQRFEALAIAQKMNPKTTATNSSPILALLDAWAAGPGYTK